MARRARYLSDGPPSDIHLLSSKLTGGGPPVLLLLSVAITGGFVPPAGPLFDPLQSAPAAGMTPSGEHIVNFSVASIASSPTFSAGATPDIARQNRYLSIFQMSWSSFHWPSSFCQTTAYLSVPSCGEAPFVLNVQVPTSRAALRPSGLTSRGVHLTSPSCC